MSKKTPMTQKAVTRIQHATVRKHGYTPKGSFASRAQSAADRRNGGR